MKIHPVNHAKGDKNRYCGPSAISIVTGMSTGEAARLLRHVNGAPAIKGTSAPDMHRALALCGIRMTTLIIKPQRPKQMQARDPWTGGISHTYTETRPTLTMWLKDSQKLRTPGRVFLVSAGHHWQVISGRRFCCGRVGKIVSITDKKANRRGRVRNVFELTAFGKITTPALARKPKASASVSPCRRRLQQLERAHGFKGRIGVNSGVKDYEVPPCDIFPHGFSTMHHDWNETLGRVQHCMDPEVYESLADDEYHYSA